MTNRRTFLKQTGIVSAAFFISRDGFFKPKQLIGLQLYTLRNEIGKDVNGTLAKVAQIGYNSVEVFGYNNGQFFGLSPADFAALIKQNNLVSPSGHYMPMNFLTKGDDTELKNMVEAATKLGHKFFTIPYLTDNLRTSLDDYKKLAENLNKAGKLVKDAGMKLAYHNHDFEFKDWGGGKTGFDVLLNDTDRTLVNFEMDIYWVSRAGVDPIKLMKENAGRFKMWHVKDMDNTAAKEFTEVGSGVINYKEIFKMKKVSGMEYFFVEQDQVKIPVYESITKSFDYLKKNILG